MKVAADLSSTGTIYGVQPAGYILCRLAENLPRDYSECLACLPFDTQRTRLLAPLAVTFKVIFYVRCLMKIENLDRKKAEG